MGLYTILAPLLAGLLIAWSPQARGLTDPSGEQFNRNLDVLYAADNVVVAADYLDTPLGEVLADLSEQADLLVEGRWNALKIHELTPHTAVTLQTGRTSLATVLDRLSREVGDRWNRPRVTAYDGRLLFTSWDDRDSTNFLVTYDVRDLVHWTDPAEERDDGDRDPRFDEFLTTAERLYEVIEVITETVEPNAWVRMGGESATIRAYEGLLFVNTDMRNHRKIGELLDAMRSEVGGERADVTVAVLDVPRDVYRRSVRRHRPKSPLLARALLDHDHAVIHYRMSSPLETGRPLIVRTRRETIDLSMRVDGRVADDDVLALDVEIEMKTARGGEERLATTVRWPDRRDMALFELGTAAALTGVAGEERLVRLVLITPRMRPRTPERPTRMTPGDPRPAGH